MPELSPSEIKWLVAGTPTVPAGVPVPLSDAMRVMVASAINDAVRVAGLPAGAIVVRRGEPLSPALAQMADGKCIALESGGVWPDWLTWTWSNAKLIGFGDGPQPRLVGFTGRPSANVLIKNIAFVGAAEVGVDCRSGRLKSWRFEDITSDGYENGYSVHAPDIDNAKPENWHKDIAFVGCRAMNIKPRDNSDTFKGQGWYLANVDGLTIEDCHADNCGGLEKPNIFRHGWYIAAPNRNVVVRRSAATRCASYGIQCRPSGSVVEECAVYDCGMGLMLNGATGTCRNNVIVRGHGHAMPNTYGKGGFDLHLGSGEIAGNLVVDGPAAMPRDYYMPPAFNIGYRKTRDGQPDWEWTKLFPNGNKRPLATLGSGNLDKTLTHIDLANWAAGCHSLPPADVAKAIIAAARR